MITVTDLREQLEAIEAQGHGDTVIQVIDNSGYRKVIDKVIDVDDVMGALWDEETGDIDSINACVWIRTTRNPYLADEPFAPSALLHA